MAAYVMLALVILVAIIGAPIVTYIENRQNEMIEKEYLNRRAAQELLAQSLPINATVKQMETFLAEDLELQRFDADNAGAEKKALTLTIETALLYRISLFARRERITVSEYVEKRLMAALETRR